MPARPSAVIRSPGSCVSWASAVCVGGRKFRTTRPDDRAARPPDLVDRQFTATRPNELWVTDLTYVPTWSGVAYVCFIVDVFSRTIVGWRVASNMRTDMVLDALEMARFHRGTRLDGLVCHSDAGQPVHVDPLHRTARRDRRPPSIGSVADSLRQRARRDRQRALQDRADPTDRARGAPSTTSSWPRSPGSTGSTPHGFTAPSATSRPPSSKPPTTLSSPQQAERKPNHRASTEPRAVQLRLVCSSSGTGSGSWATYLIVEAGHRERRCDRRSRSVTMGTIPRRKPRKRAMTTQP